MYWNEEMEDEKEKYIQALIYKKQCRDHPFYVEAREWIKYYSKTPEGKEYTRKYMRKYQNKRRHTDINFRLRGSLAASLRNILKRKGYSKSDRTLSLIGCSVDFLKKYLENKFVSGMTWDNWGTGWNGKGMQEWHIDHIKPCISFDLSKSSEQRKCFHFTNLQPLWAEDNLKKSDNYRF